MSIDHDACAAADILDIFERIAVKQDKIRSVPPPGNGSEFIALAEEVCGVAGLMAGFNSGKMKCVNSATPGPMKMNQARKPAKRIR